MCASYPLLCFSTSYTKAHDKHLVAEQEVNNELAKLFSVSLFLALN